MLYRFSLLAYGSLLLSTAFSAPYESIGGPNSSVVARSILSKRAEPNTGDDLPDLPNHPNQLDQVETAFNDALELAYYVLLNIDTDTTIFPNYFDEGDKAGVKNVFVAILGVTGVPEAPPVGNDLLGNILVQTTDVRGECSDGDTLAYMGDGSTENPFIVLCPNAFKKKAVTILNGADVGDTNWYITCDDLVNNGHVSYLMNSLGATLLHEYTHFDGLIEYIFGAPIIDEDNGYGPFNVYNNLAHSLSCFNADSYMYYALQIFWTEICQPENGFGAPRAGIDDVDPDCGGQVCQN